jgi:hypothetical protein
MKRRNFLAASAVASSAILSKAKNSNAQESGGKQQYLELRKYQMLIGKKKKELNDFLKDVAIPAWNRAGIEPVGIFNPHAAVNQPTVFVLLPHPNIESVVNLRKKLENDKEYQQSGADFLNTPLDDAKYYRVESTLMRAFKNFPKAVVPELKKQGKSRLFEYRIYESHSELYAKKKIHMFNEGGEIEIFLKTGLIPVFFGETVVGEKIPNLTYMVVFENFAEREKAWNSFRNHPDWKKLSSEEKYKNTVSNITRFYLQPTNFSQI